MKRNWRARRALRSAAVLDEIVDGHAALLPRLPESSRAASAEYLAELVMLAASYRHFAAGWISRRELTERGRFTVERIETIRGTTAGQLTEPG